MMLTSRAVALMALAGTASCIHHRATPAVSLAAVHPDSVIIAGGAVVEVVLHGRGFAPGTPGRNTVVFGSYAINDVPANSDGTEIRLVVPETMPSGGEAAPQPILPGAYQVRVRSPRGESNAIVVRIYR
jgi:hypothetical protein